MLESLELHKGCQNTESVHWLNNVKQLCQAETHKSLDNKSIVQQVVKFLHCSFVNTTILRSQAVCCKGLSLM